MPANHAFGRPGNDLLSRALRHSTIGAKGLHGRVRNGIGCGPLAIATRSSKRMVCREWCNNPDERTSGVRLVTKINRDHRSYSYRRTLPLYAAGLLPFVPRRVGPRRVLQTAYNQANRAISTGQLHVLPRFHIQPINVVVFHGSHARPSIKVGFPLRCFQRLSLPYLATRRCSWRNNRYTRGTSTPVLSY